MVYLQETIETVDGRWVRSGRFAATFNADGVAQPGELGIDDMLVWARAHFDEILIHVGWDVYSAGRVDSPDATKQWPAEGIVFRRRFDYEPPGSAVYRTWWVELQFDEPPSIPAMMQAFERDPRVVDVVRSTARPDIVRCCLRPPDGQSVTATAFEVIDAARPPIDDEATVAAYYARFGPEGHHAGTRGGIAIGDIQPGPE